MNAPSAIVCPLPLFCVEAQYGHAAAKAGVNDATQPAASDEEGLIG